MEYQTTKEKEEKNQRKPMENKVPEEGKRTSGQLNGEGAPQAEGGEASFTRNTNGLLTSM
ncbi:unnamed protein product [Orchesella dallaii]|uniref:Uncharacterized protein n=1 Tax=Orchesella dallaii TaxID=48710 RepID=A0ABP1RH33_9HEXA